MLNLYLPFLTTISGSINSLEICITVDKFNILTTEIWYVYTFFILYHFSITTGNIYLELNVQKRHTESESQKDFSLTLISYALKYIFMKEIKYYLFFSSFQI